MTEKSRSITIELDPDRPVVAAICLEEKLGLTGGYLKTLLLESDWAFVVKMHALVEAAVAHVLTLELRRPELEPIFARLELANPATGKICVRGGVALPVRPGSPIHPRPG